MGRNEDKPVISVHDLTKRFGNFTAVDHITFQVAPGEIFGFLGANGAGKTTAMRMLCGLSFPTEGGGTVDGYDIVRQSEQVKRHIGYMSQKFSLYENLTVIQNIRLFGAIYGLSDREIRDRSDRMFAELQMEGMRDTLVHDIPTGWKQKLAFSVATIHRPAVVFLDEPTGGVDPLTRRKFWELIYKSSSEGMPVPESDISVVYKYNPTLNFKNYMIPGLMVVLVIIICGFLPAINIVNEKQTGTIEAMNVTPVSKMTFVLSKLIPFWVAGVVIVTIGMVIGWAVYGLSPQGPIWSIYLATLLFSLVMSGLGVFISNKSATIMQSIFLMFAFIMIFQLMAGLFTPISSMPQWAQYITYMVPPRYFIEIMRAVYLKGTTMSELLPQFGALTAFAAGMLLLAAFTYRKQN